MNGHMKGQQIAVPGSAEVLVLGRICLAILFFLSVVNIFWVVQVFGVYNFSFKYSNPL